MRYFNAFLTPQNHPLFAQLMLVVCLGVMFTFNSTLTSKRVDIHILRLDQGYIPSLHLTVTENDRGDIEIVKTGIYSPFRRYSWFRVGDMIEIINGERTSVLVLHSLRYHETPWIKYRRGNDIFRVAK